MSVQPVFETDAGQEVQQMYRRIKKALGSRTLPLFICYIGAFPEYLSYIEDQIVLNLDDHSFKKLAVETSHDAVSLIAETLPQSADLTGWIKRYRMTPAFHTFQADLHNILLINTKLAYIFIALREAVKGWAVAAKKLPSSNGTQKDTAEKNPAQEDFIYDETLVEVKTEPPAQKEDRLVSLGKDIAARDPFAIEKNLIGEYFNLCRMDFDRHMKTDPFWILRVGFEKMVLHGIHIMPHPINSPINVFIKLTEQYDNFDDLLYLLLGDFPTYSIHRLMFSGYMIDRH